MPATTSPTHSPPLVKHIRPLQRHQALPWLGKTVTRPRLLPDRERDGKLSQPETLVHRGEVRRRGEIRVAASFLQCRLIHGLGGRI